MNNQLVVTGDKDEQTRFLQAFYVLGKQGELERANFEILTSVYCNLLHSSHQWDRVEILFESAQVLEDGSLLAVSSQFHRLIFTLYHHDKNKAEFSSRCYHNGELIENRTEALDSKARQLLGYD